MIALLLAACQDYALRCQEPEHDEPLPCEGVCLNEVGANNRTWVTDTGDVALDDPLEQTEDWIELYNAGEPYDIGQLEIERRDNGYSIAPLPPQVLQRGECVLLVANAQPVGPRELPFDLNADFGTLRLRTVDDGCIVDRLYYPRQDSTYSWSRVPDGGDDWSALDEPTPCGPPRLLEPGEAP